MNVWILYSTTVLIWGSTWFAIQFQLDAGAATVSIAYRFALAAALLFLYCRWRGLPLLFNKRAHVFMALQGVCLFSLNYWFIYSGTAHLTSGLVAITFSTMVIMNLFNSYLWLGTKLDKQVLFSALLGLFGLALIFFPELIKVHFSSIIFYSITLCLLGTFMASLGNIIALRNQQKKLPILQGNAWGMLYGALSMVLFTLIKGDSFTIQWSLNYINSLLYLTIFGTIIGFGCYLTLLGKVGAGKAAYSTLLFPLVALTFSTLFESYQWTAYAIAGVVLIFIGNLLVMVKAAHWLWLRTKLGYGKKTPALLEVV